MADDNEIARTLGRVEGKVDMLIDLAKVDRKRLHAVERKQWMHTGGLAALVFVLNKMGLPVHWS
jgi:hypothetical protein